MHAYEEALRGEAIREDQVFCVFVPFVRSIGNLHLLGMKEHSTFSSFASSPSGEQQTHASWGP